MRRLLLAWFTLLGVACVDVPQSIHAEFAGPSATDRTNYRQGTHGSAPAVEDPRPSGAIPTTSATIAADGGAPSLSTTASPTTVGAPYNPLAAAATSASDAGAPVAPPSDGGSK